MVISRGCHLLHILTQRDAIEELPDHVKDFIGAKFLANALHFLQQGLHNAALARLPSHKVEDMHGIVFLPVAVDAPHALFQSGRIPGDIVVDHQPADLEIDALTSRVGCHQVGCAALRHWSPEGRNLLFALLVVHAAVNLRNLFCEPHAFQATHQEIQRVAVFGEDDKLLMLVIRIAQDGA